MVRTDMCEKVRSLNFPLPEPIEVEESVSGMVNVVSNTSQS